MQCIRPTKLLERKQILVNRIDESTKRAFSLNSSLNQNKVPPNPSNDKEEKIGQIQSPKNLKSIVREI